MIGRDSGDLTAVEAKSYAQWIAFGPFAFYAAVVMRDTGLLDALDRADRKGVDLAALASRTGLSEYSVSVLLDFGAHMGLACKADELYTLGKVGHYVLHDEMTLVNMNFTRDVCYQALPFLEESLRTQTPAGLKTLGPWKTVYEGLTQQPEPAKSSWFRFDHFYSDRVFDAVLPIVFAEPVRQLLDVGGNTGRWACKCLEYDPRLKVTLMDLPSQLAVARENMEAAGFGDRVNYHAADLLDDAAPFHEGADVIWMSQFLDCFSEDEVGRILRRAAGVMGEDTVLYIIEHFPDRQAFDAAAFSLDATSLYFSCVANGNSRMYHYEPFKALVHAAGLRIERQIDDVGIGHTVLCCKRSAAVGSGG